ncbi:MAG TPA: hypothetical protein DGT23_12865 [Micromonosporaceae bacterium]|nr:hypothetical protein [Micromonosporaceae bacterium]
MSLRTRALLVAGSLCMATLFAATPAQAATPVVLSQGHVDVIGVAYEDGQLHVHVHDETVEPGVEREPCDVIFEVKSAARTTVPDDPAYAFLGNAGDSVWILPEVEDPNLLFAGLGTEEITAGQLAGDTINVKLSAVYGPGDVSVFTTNEFGAPAIIFDSGNGLPDALALAAGSHQHANWAFENAGWYRLVFRVTARDAVTNALVSSGPVSLRFKVVA